MAKQTQKQETDQKTLIGYYRECINTMCAQTNNLDSIKRIYNVVRYLWVREP